MSEEPVKIEIDIDDMTIGEVDDFETYVGKPLAEVDLTSPPAKALVALVWISERRKDASYTIDQARGVKISALPGGDDEASEASPPTPPGGGDAS